MPTKIQTAVPSSRPEFPIGDCVSAEMKDRPGRLAQRPVTGPPSDLVPKIPFYDGTRPRLSGLAAVRTQLGTFPVMARGLRQRTFDCLRGGDPEAVLQRALVGCASGADLLHRLAQPDVLAMLPEIRRLPVLATRLRQDEALALAKLLNQHAPQVEEVRLGEGHVGAECLRLLAQLPNLRRLTLYACQLRGLKLSELAAAQKLEYLDISRNDLMPLGLQVCSELPGLHCLVLQDCAVTASHLCDLVGVVCLETLRLDGCRLDGHALNALWRVKQLVNLSLDDVPFARTSRGLSCLAGLQKLEKLLISNADISGRQLDALPSMPALRTLQCRGHTLGPAGTHALVEKLPNLVNLDLADSDLDDAAAEHLVRLKALQFLDVRNNRIGDAGAKRLATLPDLRCLALLGNHVQDACAIALEEDPEKMVICPRVPHAMRIGEPVPRTPLRDLMAAFRLVILLACTQLTACGEVAHSAVGSAQFAAQGLVFGQDATPADFPPVGALYDERDGELQGMCTGTLIAPDTVLTAAHCVSAPIQYLRFTTGVTIQSRQDRKENRVHGVRNVVTHPAWSYGQMWHQRQHHDLALVFLSAAVPDVTPMRLLAASERGILKQDSTVTLVGYGRNEVDVEQHQGLGSGRQRYAGIRLYDVGVYELALGVHDGGPRMCHGDSDGPALMQAAGASGLVWVQIGVSSHHYGEDYECTGTGVSTRVDRYRGWIEDVMVLEADGG